MEQYSVTLFKKKVSTREHMYQDSVAYSSIVQKELKWTFFKCDEINKNAKVRKNPRFLL